MIDPDLAAKAQLAAGALVARGETIAVAEGSCGGVISAALLAVPGASAYFLGGAVIYTAHASRAFMSGSGVDHPPHMRGASEDFAQFLARAVRTKLGATWGIGEGGAAGPKGNPYGDAPGHAWVAVAGPVEMTRHLLTGNHDRAGNIVAFAVSSIDLLLEQDV